MEKLEDYIELTKKIETVVYSNKFYPISQLKKLFNLNKDEIKIKLKSLNEESEKNIIAFYPSEYPEGYLFFPIKFFKISNKSKFISLEHKHYLGSILSLGIKRDILGDLLVKNEICYGIIMEEMFDFLKNNLIKIKTAAIEIVEITEEEVPKSEFKELNITVPSLRLDSVVSEISKFSREKSVNTINIGEVQVNYEVVREKNYKIIENDIITIRKFGKFIISKNLGLTKKNKLKILIKKYV